jgi:ABC-type glycerol-3-phosphate transport system substrate-binding protein
LQRNTHAKRWARRLLTLALVGTLGITSASEALLFTSGTASAADAPQQTKSDDRLVVKAQEFEPYYADVLKGWVEKSVKPASGTITIQASKFSQKSEFADTTVGTYEGKSNVLQWRSTRESWVEYEIDAPSDGLYEAYVTYRPITGQGLRKPATLSVFVDGKFQFRESTSTVLYRQWQDATPIKKDDEGHDIRPKSLDISAWSEKPLRDATGAYAEPLQWNLTKGKHTIRLQGFEPIAIETIKLQPKTALKSYSEVAAAYPKSNPPAVQPILIEAEAASSKTDSAIQMASDTDARTVPQSKGKITFNTIGGKKWWDQNQELTWTFQVDEPGMYHIGMRSLQNFISQKSSFRRIAIDGKVPFQEFIGYRFPYATSWKGTIISDENNKPFDIYLDKGTHTLSMAVTHHPFKPIMIGIEDTIEELRVLDQDLRSLTGGIVDKNRTWKIEQDLPDLPKQLKQAADMMTDLANQMEKINGRSDNITQGFRTSVVDIEDMLMKVDDIPYHEDEITSMMEKIGKFTDIIIQQPLQLDEIYFIPSGQNAPKMRANIFERMFGSVMNFFYSFQPKESLSDLKDDELNVWVLRGRDYVNLIQEMADELFTPETGMKVKVNLLPNAQLLIKANAANIQPDIALGLSQDLPVDYALRDSIVDLSKLPGFDNVFKQFAPGTWMPFYYNGGYWAVPEAQSFQVLYYRKDILARLGLSVPNTWEDVYDMLPTLQQNYMNFYVPPKEFITYFYQNNADFYNKDGTHSNLTSPEGFKAFKQWVDQFNIYAMEREVPNFYQHFRKGDMPIGIADYNQYVKLSAAAPELTGNWGIAPTPGIKQPDGVISRWAGGNSQTGVLFKKSNKQDVAWKFMQWWVSADIQERFGADLESFNGIAFRWNTANVEAFSKLPWKREDANVILEQWKWYKEMPNVPGGYFTTREIQNAWNRTVVDGLNYRDSLELTVMDVDRELRRKQQEFGFVDANGNMVKSLEIPPIDKPWEGVNKYVK